MSGTNIPVSSTVNVLGAIVNMGAAQNSTSRSFGCTCPGDIAGSPPSSVAVLASGDNFVLDVTLLKVINAGDPLTTVVGVCQYLRSMRLNINNPTTPACNLTVDDLTPASSVGGPAFVLNGNAFGQNALAGTTDAFSMGLEAGGTTFLLAGSGGAGVTMTATTGQATVVASVGAANLLGGGAAASAVAGAFKVASTTTGTIAAGSSLAVTSVTTMALTATTTFAATGTAATMTATTGAATLAATAANVAITAGTSIQLTSTTTAGVTAGSSFLGQALGGTWAMTATGLASMTGSGASLIATATTAAAVTSSGAGGSTTFLFGTGGLGVGVAAVAANITMDTPAAGAFTLGGTNATSFVLGGIGSALATITANVPAGGTVTIGGGAATASTTNIAIGTGVKTLHLADGASVNVITIGGAASTLGFYGAAPVVQGAVSTNANRIVAGATAAFTESTYDGGLGGNAYTVGGLVLRLKQYGLLA